MDGMRERKGSEEKTDCLNKGTIAMQFRVKTSEKLGVLSLSDKFLVLS